MRSRDSVMEHKTRKMIFNYIVSHPGVNFRTLKEMFDLTDGTLRYHLGYLEKAKQVDSRYKGGKKVFFPHDLGAPAEGGRDLNRSQKRLVSIINADPGITKRELHHRTNLSRKELETSLRRLLEQGVVKKLDEDGVEGYWPATRKDQDREVFKLLVIKLIRNEIDEETFNMLRDELEKR